METISVTIQDIQVAQQLLKKQIRRTEVIRSEAASVIVGQDVWLKKENEQITGSFKIRGALNKIASLTAEEKHRGIIASSAGNHAQGVALAAKLAGVSATIVMPKNAPLIKVDSTRSHGARVILHGENYDDAFEHASLLREQQNLVFVHPFDDAKVIAGQGTLGLELVEQLPDVENFLIPIGGGGLISGVALAIKSLKPNAKVYGVVSDKTPAIKNLFENKPIQTFPRVSTLADGIAVKKPSPRIFQTFIQKLVDGVISVSDEEIAEAIVFLLERNKTVVEGSGAVGLAALLKGKLKVSGPVCVALCGGNIDLNVISRVIERGQIERGRLAELTVIVDDIPGTLNRLTQIISAQGANVLQVHHDRISDGLNLRETKIEFLLETSSLEQVRQIRQVLQDQGIRLSSDGSAVSSQ